MAIQSLNKVDRVINDIQQSLSQARISCTAEDLSRSTLQSKIKEFEYFTPVEKLEFVLKCDNTILDILLNIIYSDKNDKYLYALPLDKLIKLKYKCTEKGENFTKSILLTFNRVFSCDNDVINLISKGGFSNSGPSASIGGMAFRELNPNATIFDEDFNSIEQADFKPEKGPMFCLQVGENQVVVHHSYFDKFPKHPIVTDLLLEDFFDTDKVYKGQPLAIYKGEKVNDMLGRW